VRQEGNKSPSPLEGEGRGGGPHKLISRARHLRRNATVAERRLWKRLRRDALEGLSFRRPDTIAPYVVDFFCPSAKLIVELDGEYFHGDVLRAQRDEARTRSLSERGYKVIRFSNSQVMRELEGVLAAIAAAAGVAPPSLTLPLEGGGKRILADASDPEPGQ
jgi:very-short-patch-repair endonuclease